MARGALRAAPLGPGVRLDSGVGVLSAATRKAAFAPRELVPVGAAAITARATHEVGEVRDLGIRRGDGDMVGARGATARITTVVAVATCRRPLAEPTEGLAGAGPPGQGGEGPSASRIECQAKRGLYCGGS